jgi:hypothetical protein
MGTEALFSWQQLLYGHLGFKVWHLGAQLVKSAVSHCKGSLPKFHISVVNPLPC